MPPPSLIVLATVERLRKRLWAHCYRMTGRRTSADDLCQEALARAIERADDLSDPTRAESWLFRIATTVCLDHLRRDRRTRAVTELVEPVVLEAAPHETPGPEATVILRDDVRFAVVVALQHLSPKQRAVLLLHDVCDAPLADVADVLGTNPNAAKASLHRARAALVRARGRVDCDVAVDPAVVEQLAEALASRSVDALARLLADDVWGVVDGGGVVAVASKPSFGARALLRRYANLSRRTPVPVACRVLHLNGEPAVLVSLPTLGDMPFSTVHVETRAGRIVAMRVVRDPTKLVAFAAAPQ